MTAALRFDPIRLPEECEKLRKEVRAFLAEEIAKGTFDPHSPQGGDNDVPGFSKRVGERGWIGMTWPKKYGGHERIISRALCGDRGNARCQCADTAFFRRRPAERSGTAEIRARAYQDGHPAAHLPRRSVLLDRHERAQFRLGPVRRQDQGDQDRRRLSDQRHQDLDLVGAGRQLHAGDLPHLAVDQGKPPARADAIPRRHEDAGHQGQPDRATHRQSRIQRGGIHGRLRACRSRARRDRRRLETGNLGARL